MKFLQPQWEFVRPGVDLLGRFEALGAWWEELGRRLRVDLGPLPHLNASEHPTVEEAYDDGTRRLVRDVYAADFDNFGYGG